MESFRRNLRSRLLTLGPIATAGAAATMCLSLPAYGALKGKYGVGLSTGLPQFVGLDLRYQSSPQWTFGLSFGSAPVNGVLNKQIQLNPTEIVTSSPDTHFLNPHASYSLIATYLYARYALNNAMFVQTGISYWTFRADMSGDVENRTTQQTSFGAVGGSGSVNQLHAGLAVGWQWALAESLGFEVAIGGNYHFKPGKNFDTSGSAAGVLPAVGDEQAGLDASIQDTDDQFTAEVTRYGNEVGFSPIFFVGLAVMF